MFIENAQLFEIPRSLRPESRNSSKRNAINPPFFFQYTLNKISSILQNIAYFLPSFKIQPALTRLAEIIIHFQQRRIKVGTY